MSFKLFIYYCMVCGAWAALAGWALGRWLAPSGEVARAMVKGMCLGTLVALGLGIVDSLWSSSTREVRPLFRKGFLAGFVGCTSGLVGGAVGQLLINATDNDVLVIVGWTLTGLLIGGSIGLLDLARQVSLGKKPGGELQKMGNGVIGGVLGGILGGILFSLAGLVLGRVFDKPPYLLLSSSACGFTLLGACIGLFVGLAQVILKEGWVRVEAGFRVGRELLLTKEETVIGRAESCDIGLFGDHAVERLHARILRRENRYVVVDGGSQAGTFVNDQRISQPTALRSGDAIRLGKNVLRFGERHQPTQK